MLSVEGLSVELSGNTLLSRISFELKAGEMLCVVGESGSGKTTLLKALQGLLPISEGCFNHHFVNENKSRRYGPGDCFLGLPNVSWVMQNPLSALNPQQMIGEAIGEGLYHRSLGKAEQLNLIVQALREVELSEVLMDRYPQQISVGQAQRVCIARALVSRPELILFDEPLSALDAVVQKQIGRTIESLKSSYDFSSIFVTHDLGFARAYADHVLLLRNGKIEAYQNAEDFFVDPASTYGAELIEAAHILGALSPSAGAKAIRTRA